MMYRTGLLLLASLLCCVAATPAQAYLQVGDVLPPSTVMAPITDEYADILQVPKGQPFQLTDIKAPFLLVQLFSMYCPHCQREAPHMNDMYAQVLKSGQGEKLAILGIGTGNSEFETNYFRKQYDVPFPLSPDPDYALQEVTGRVGTPYYILSKRVGDDWEIIFLQEGTFEDTQTILLTLQEHTGLPLVP